ncbi:hypothetical protein D9M71_283190 [compost metagenome]
MFITVAVVKRRFSGSLSTTCQRPLTFFRRITPAPWALISLRTSSTGRLPLLSLVGPLGCRASASMYSWLIASRPSSELPLMGKKCMPSWCMPTELAWSAAVLLPSAFHGLALVFSGVPQGART